MLLAAMGFSAPLAAQDQKFEISLFGDANAPLQNLNTVPNLGFKSGFGGGVGITYLADKNFAIRGDFGYVTSDVSVALSGRAPIRPVTTPVAGAWAATSVGITTSNAPWMADRARR